MKRIQLEGRSDLKSEIPLESPYTIFIDPSSVCNFRCEFCMNSKIKKPSFMKWETYTKIIDDLQEFENPIKVARLYGFGEPMLNPLFSNMVWYAKQSSKVLAIDTTTNGSKLSEHVNMQLISSGIDRINISIEGVSSEQYKRFTGQNVDFNRLLKNIEHLYKNKNDTIVFTKICGDYLSDEEKAEFHRLFDPISDGAAIEYSMNCWYDMEVDTKNTEVGVYGQPLEDVDICPYIFYSMAFQSDGTCSVCFLDWNKKMVIGDIKYSSVKEIWNSDVFNSFRVSMLKGIKNKICANCDQLKAGMPVNLDPYREELLKRMI